MNKNLFIGLFLALGLLLGTSCSKEEPNTNVNGEKAIVSFSLGIQNAMKTSAKGKRVGAISDGTGVNKLVYSIFDSEGNRIDALPQVVKTSVSFPATEQIRLTKGQTYKIAFWAQDSACEAYTVSNDMKVTVNHTGVNNDESRDAFFASVTFTVGQDANINVVMKRPFAQLNVGATTEDWDAAVASGMSITKSKVNVSNVANSINLLDGSVQGTGTMAYTLADIPTEILVTDADGDGTTESYKYLSMSYLLADAVGKTTLNTVSFEFVTDGGKTINFSDGLSNVPVQRNWRTNIVGNILTNKVDFTISIDPIYDGEYNNGEAYGVKANNTYYKTIKDAIDAGATEIELAAGDYVIPKEAKGKTLTFIGTGTPEDVKVAVVGTGYENHDYSLDGSTVTFESITITTNSSTYIGYARCNGTYKNCVINGTYTLSGESKFENCTFNVSGDVYNIWTWGSKNMEFDRCTFNSDGKALLLYQEGTNTVNLTVKSCIFNDKGGLTSKKAAIEIGDASYGATPTYNVTVSGTTVNGYEINDQGINTGTTLWGNKNSMPAGRLNVTVDGVKVY